jgi:hypothetical protein
MRRQMGFGRQIASACDTMPTPLNAVSCADAPWPVLSGIASSAAVVYRVDQTIARIKSEYDEMPGLCLTSAQAARLFGVDPTVCANVLAACVDVGFLRMTSDRFIRA